MFSPTRSSPRLARKSASRGQVGAGGEVVRALYTRKLDTDSARVEAFLKTHNFSCVSRVDLSRLPAAMDEAALLELCHTVKRIVVVDLADEGHVTELQVSDLDDEKLLGAIKGRRGNLRSPCMVAGDRMYLGYSESFFADHVKPALEKML